MHQESNRSTDHQVKRFPSVAILAGVVSLVVLAGALTLTRRSEVSPAASELTVLSAWVRPAEVGGTSAIYFTIDNPTATIDRLISIQTEGDESVELHRTQVDEHGVARMAPLRDGLEIPAGATIRAEPDGLHVMLTDVDAALKPGEYALLTFQFASGKSISVEALVTDTPPLP